MRWRSASNHAEAPRNQSPSAVRALEKAGFWVARQGKHIVMRNDVSRILTIPRHNPVNALTMGGIVRDAGLTIEEFKPFSRSACQQCLAPPQGSRLIDSQIIPSSKLPNAAYTRLALRQPSEWGLLRRIVVVRSANETL